MRDIRFKAWHKKQKRMCRVTSINFITGDVNIADLNNKGLNKDLIETWNASDIELRQCTGLRDCRGHKIYEGDILRGYHAIPSEAPVFQVYWDRGGFIVRSSGDGMRYDIGDIEHKELEIIGNIYEHPELLG